MIFEQRWLSLSLSLIFAESSRIPLDDDSVRWPFPPFRLDDEPYLRKVFPSCQTEMRSPIVFFPRIACSANSGNPLTGIDTVWFCVSIRTIIISSLPPSLPLFRASANDARMRRLPSIKIRRVNIINRDDPKALRILPETGYIPNPSRPAFNADSTDNVYRRSSSRLLSRIDLKITMFDGMAMAR